MRAMYGIVGAVVGALGAMWLGGHKARADAEDPQVTLYRQRVEIAKIQIGRSQSQLRRDEAHRQIMQRLYSSSAVSREEVLSAELAADLSAWGVKDATVRVAEAEALHEVAKARTAAGLDMPICTTR